MIGYFPEIYPDELIYSWISRYYAHSGYSSYCHVLEELTGSKFGRIDYEFAGHFNGEVRTLFERMYGYRDLILRHTMFPYYGRFVNADKRQNALDCLLNGNGDIHNALPFPKSNEVRFLRYCPKCAEEDRENYGESYIHCVHQVRQIAVCPHHGCKLLPTDISIVKGSPRLYVPEESIPQSNPSETGLSIEIKFSRYMAEVFCHPINLENDNSISAFLRAALEDTEYISKRGKSIYVSRLAEDLNSYYSFLGTDELRPFHIQKLFSGLRVNFFDVCRVAFFLNIPASKLCNPELPELSQTERFNQEVANLQEKGLGSHRIGSMLGVSSSTALKANRANSGNGREKWYGNRKGCNLKYWEQFDKEHLEEVKQVIHTIYTGEGNRPMRVSIRGVEKAMGWPGKRLYFLPLCKAEVEKNIETQQEYWAREVVWAYEKLRKELGEKTLYWRTLRDMTNIRRVDFESTFPLLTRYTDTITAEKIKSLLG